MVIATEVAQHVTQHVTQMLTYEGQQTGVTPGSGTPSPGRDKQHNKHAELVSFPSDTQRMTCQRRAKRYSSVVLRSLGIAIREVKEEQNCFPSPEKCELGSSVLVIKSELTPRRCSKLTLSTFDSHHSCPASPGTSRS